MHLLQKALLEARLTSRVLQSSQLVSRTARGPRILSRKQRISTQNFSTSPSTLIAHHNNAQRDPSPADKHAQRRAEMRQIEDRLASEGLSDDELARMLERRQQILNELAKERPFTYWSSVILGLARASAVWVVPPMALLVLLWPTERKKEKWED